MRNWTKRINSLLCCLGLLVVIAMPAFGQSVDSLKLIPDNQQTLVTIYTSDISEIPKVFSISGENTRLVVDYKIAKPKLGGVKKANGQTHLQGVGHVRNIRYALREETGLRLVFDLAKDARFLKTDATSKNPTHYEIKIVGRPLPKISRSEFQNPNLPELPPQTNPIKMSPINLTEPSQNEPQVKQTPIKLGNVTKPRYFKNSIPVPRLAPPPDEIFDQTEIVKRPVIVIDAGHGGYDPGAIGQGKTKEKVITMAASKELRRQLLQTGKYDVVLTRSRDVYIDHEERLKIARKAGADLFISVHADSTQTHSARGASVYTLADRAKGRSRNIVRSQNWILDVDLDKQTDPVGDILVDLAQRNTSSQSDAFADVLLTQLKGTTRLIGNSHRKAGYFVLLAPDVPAVLLELGFLSNASDEKLLNNSAYRQKIMRAVTDAINTYFNHQRS